MHPTSLAYKRLILIGLLLASVLLLYRLLAIMSLPRTMRAVVCPSVPISPSQLVYTTTHPTPQPKAGYVLIRVKGFGLNRSELFTRQGLSPGLVFPRVLGIECVGVVKDAGGGKWKEGDVVAAIMVSY
jgi:NADPH:quinone reductase-like Zn-dependent oxidoreductase